MTHFSPGPLTTQTRAHNTAQTRLSPHRLAPHHTAGLLTTQTRSSQHRRAPHHTDSPFTTRRRPSPHRRASRHANRSLTRQTCPSPSRRAPHHTDASLACSPGAQRAVMQRERFVEDRLSKSRHALLSWHDWAAHALLDALWSRFLYGKNEHSAGSKCRSNEI